MKSNWFGPLVLALAATVVVFLAMHLWPRLSNLSGAGNANRPGASSRPEMDAGLRPASRLPGTGELLPSTQSFIANHKPSEGMADGESTRAVAAEDAIPDAPELVALQNLLDDNDNPGILRQATSMATAAHVDQRSAAIEALRWVGGLEAGRVLLQMSADPHLEIADGAQDALLEVLAEIDDPRQTAPFWEQAIRNAGGEGARDALLLQLSSQSVQYSMPILLNLLESGIAPVVESAKEYLEFVTHGETITSRAAGEAWLRNWQAEETAAEVEAGADKVVP